VQVNPAEGLDRIDIPLDGRTGRGTAPFVAEADQFGRQLPFAVTWSGTPDVTGGIISRSAGSNSAQLERFAERFDSTDVYRMLYASLFGRGLPATFGERAPDREPEG
jgi:alkaline phosphatase